MEKYLNGMNNLVNQKWFNIIFITTTSFYLYTFMEWIFFITKPSFMSSMNISQKLTIFFMSSFFLAIPGVILTTLFAVLSKLGKFFFWLWAIIPAFVIAILSIILLDNFTYTIFKFGIGTSEGNWRGVYAILFLIFFVYFLKKIVNLVQIKDDHHLNVAYIFIILLLVTSVIIVGVNLHNINFSAQKDTVSGVQTSNLPNIILLGFDGVNATNMSVYGYDRDTTPNLSKLAENTLIVENAFSNGGNTGGSITSLLTGKLPTDTRVVYPPDILMEEDAYQHLPGMLRQLGYTTIQISDSTFSDAYSRNIKDGFDIANSRSEGSSFLLNTLGRFGGGGSFYFYALLVQRATERLEHIIYLRTMDNPYKLVTHPVSELSAQEQYNAVISALDIAKSPLFLHAHLLGTHGPQFNPSKNIFSVGEIQDKSWMVDFYDDAIHDSDIYIKSLFDYLNNTGKINNTVIILYSDHGINWNPLIRVPLIFWFPNNQFVGKVHENVQLIDIAPTILDYLGVSKPAWMHGQSIINENIPPARYIFSVEQAADLVTHNESGWVVDENQVFPPFYQLGKVNLVVCNHWFSLDLREPQLKYGEVAGSTTHCGDTIIPAPQQSKELILQHLSAAGYDTTSYPSEIPYIPVTTSSQK
ncbi:MAG: hypothetical protein A2136_07495 [Chloroflexi bacterium RBG_16_54_11]|nr:MAG: hypothetical protein A2136_07495 [Chloroflexi bacterium RBG_16_54_11]